MWQLGKRANNAIAAVLPFMLVVLWPFSFLHRMANLSESRRRVLLVSRNVVAADHMICIHDLLKTDESIELIVTTDRFPAREFAHHNAASIIGAESLHILRALVSHWDLIIFTNHPYGLGICFPPWIKKLYVNHGIHSGKINNDQDQDGVYGRCKVIRPFGMPYYDCMFAASYWEKAYAIRQTPQLEGHIEVVGFLRADLFLDYVQGHASIVREKLGYTADKKVVHIISTWGANSLYATSGAMILEQVMQLREKYDFVVSIHPRFDDLGDRTMESRETIFSRFEAAGARINRGLDWEDYVAASDIAIADHSSLALYHVLVGHPLLFADVDSSQYVEGSTFDQLTQHCSRLSQYDSLDEAIADSIVRLTEGGHTDLANHMLDFKGSARQEYLKHINVLLGEPM